MSIVDTTCCSEHRVLSRTLANLTGAYVIARLTSIWKIINCQLFTKHPVDNNTWILVDDYILSTDQLNNFVLITTTTIMNDTTTIILLTDNKYVNA